MSLYIVIALIQNSNSTYLDDKRYSNTDIALGLLPGWHIGRVSEGQYEYDHLNGWMTPGYFVNFEIPQI